MLMTLRHGFTMYAHHVKDQLKSFKEYTIARTAIDQYHTLTNGIIKHIKNIKGYIS